MTLIIGCFHFTFHSLHHVMMLLIDLVIGHSQVSSVLWSLSSLHLSTTSKLFLTNIIAAFFTIHAYTFIWPFLSF